MSAAWVVGSGPNAASPHHDPSQAVIDGQNGSVVYVLRPDSTVEARPVVSPRASDGFSVIDKGLEPGEMVVTDGQTRLTQGAKVLVKGQS